MTDCKKCGSQPRLDTWHGELGWRVILCTGCDNRTGDHFCQSDALEEWEKLNAK